MADKQLDFLNIFPPKKEPSKDPEFKDEILKDEKPESGINNIKTENISGGKDLRTLLSSSIDNLTISDFRLFSSDLEAYKQRYRKIRQEYERVRNLDKQGMSPVEKDDNTKLLRSLYNKLVFPQTYDDPEYRGIAELYLKYEKVEKNEVRLQAMKKRAEEDKHKKFSSGRTKKFKNINSKSRKKKASSKENNSNLKKTNTDSQDSKQQEQDDSSDPYRNDPPDPYGDIYPYSRTLRGLDK